MTGQRFGKYAGCELVLEGQPIAIHFDRVAIGGSHAVLTKRTTKTPSDLGSEVGRLGAFCCRGDGLTASVKARRAGVTWGARRTHVTLTIAERSISVDVHAPEGWQLL